MVPKNLLAINDPHHHEKHEIMVELPNNERWMGELEVDPAGNICFVGIDVNGPLGCAGVHDGSILQQIGFTKLLPRDLVFACSTIRKEKKISLTLNKTSVTVFYVPAAIDRHMHAITPMRSRGDKRRHGHYDQAHTHQKINPVDGRPMLSPSARTKNRARRYSRKTKHYSYGNDWYNNWYNDEYYDARYDAREEDDLYHHKTRMGSPMFAKLKHFQSMTNTTKFKHEIDDSFTFKHVVSEGVHQVVITWTKRNENTKQDTQFKRRPQRTMRRSKHHKNRKNKRRDGRTGDTSSSVPKVPVPKLPDFLTQTVNEEDIFDALRNIIASRIRKYGHTENDTRDSFLAIDKENTGTMKMDNVASALRDFGARLREEQLYEMFKLLGEDQEDPDANDEIMYEDIISAMHRDDHLVSLASSPRFTSSDDGSVSSAHTHTSGPTGPPGPPGPPGPKRPLGPPPGSNGPPSKVKPPSKPPPGAAGRGPPPVKPPSKPPPGAAGRGPPSMKPPGRVPPSVKPPSKPPPGAAAPPAPKGPPPL